MYEKIKLNKAKFYISEQHHFFNRLILKSYQLFLNTATVGKIICPTCIFSSVQFNIVDWFTLKNLYPVINKDNGSCPVRIFFLFKTS